MLAIMATLTGSVFAQTMHKLGSISGVVVAVNDGKKLAGASVLLEHTVLGTETDAEGKFSLRDIPPGRYALSVLMIGYGRRISKVEVKPGSKLEIVIKLSPLPVQIEPVVITATKQEESLMDVPVSVSVVNGTTLMSRNAVTIKDALKYVPGVRLLQNQIDIRGLTGYSQGVGSRVLLLVDGLPMLTGDTGEIIWDAIPVDDVERIEVVKGAASALYGSSALGGVINVITRDIPESPQTSYRLYSGFYNQPYYRQWRWSDKLRGMEGIELGHSQRIGGFGFLASGGYSGDDSFRQNDFSRRWNGFAKLEYDLSTFEQIRVISDIVHERKGDFYYWRSLNDPLQPDPAQEGARSATTTWNSSFIFRDFVNNKLSYVARGIYSSNFLQYDSMGVPGSSSLANTGTIEFQGNWNTTGSQKLTFGLVGNLDKVVANQYGTHFGYGTAAYFQDEILLLRSLKLDIGLRYDAQRIVDLPAWESVSPKLGLVFLAGPATSLRASVGRGFRAPSIAELYVNAGTPYLPIVPNPDLKPERSWSFEVGLTHFFSDNFMLDCALFQSDLSNLIEAGFDSTGGNLRIMFNNVSRARVQGGEIDLKTDLFGRLLRLDIGYTYTWPVNLTTGSVLRFRSRHLLYSSATLRYKMISLGTDFRYISKMMRLDNILQSFIVNWNSQVPIEVVDVRGSIDLAQWRVPLTIGLHVNNLLGYNYVELPGNLGPLRNFVLSIEGRL